MVELGVANGELEEAADLLAGDYEQGSELTEFSRADLGSVVDDSQ
jgi:hypothetical protein